LLVGEDGVDRGGEGGRCIRGREGD